MSAPNFTGKPPAARAATLQGFKNDEQAFEMDIVAALPAAPPTVIVPCAPKFGKQPEKLVASKILTSTKILTTDVEELGELGAMNFLKKVLLRNRIPFNPKGVETFNGANAVNIAYFYPPLSNTQKPSYGVVLEAKGGNSRTGKRKDPVTGQTVTQGTADYLKAIVFMMKKSKDSKRQRSGKALHSLIKKKNRVSYVGVRTKYDKKKKTVSEPVAIFNQKI